MDALPLQRALHARGYDPGPLDGSMGPKTLAGAAGLAAGRRLGDVGVRLGRAMAPAFLTYRITSRLRICHWLAQMAHETDGFSALVERGNGDGPDPDPWDDYLERYDFRKDLGNNAGGDGEKYRGRGLIHLTGRANYGAYGARIGIDLVAQPHRAAEPEIGVTIACLFWTDKGLNTWADADDVERITRRINGGLNGLADRTERLNRLKSAWPA
jgi:predicted chitinase